MKKDAQRMGDVISELKNKIQVRGETEQLERDEEALKKLEEGNEEPLDLQDLDL